MARYMPSDVSTPCGEEEGDYSTEHNCNVSFVMLITLQYNKNNYKHIQ